MQKMCIINRKDIMWNIPIERMLSQIDCDSCIHASRKATGMTIKPINPSKPNEQSLWYHPSGNEKTLTCEYSCSKKDADIIVENGIAKCNGYISTNIALKEPAPAIIHCKECANSYPIDVVTGTKSPNIRYGCKKQIIQNVLILHTEDYFCADGTPRAKED